MERQRTDEKDEMDETAVLEEGRITSYSVYKSGRT